MRGPDRQPWRLGPQATRWFDGLLTVALALPAPVYVAAGLYDALAGATATSDTLLIGVLGGAQTVPLAWRRRHPVPVFAVVALASALQSVLVDTPIWSQLAFPVATYSVARFAGRWQGAAALTIGLIGAVVASVVWLRGFYADELTVQNVSYYAVTIALIELAAWALGTLGRTRQAYVDALVERGQRLEREAAQQAALAAIEERNRIAREMHDVVAHGLTTIVVQADGARAAAVHDPDLARTALGTIATSGREAIAELRRMLGLLRAEEASVRPQPRLADLPGLLEESQRAGAAVSADLPDPLPDVPDGVALTAYRIVQEALSNVRKHAGPGAAARVRLVLDDRLVVEIRDDGRGAAAPDDGRGHGLTGMAERVAAHDGELVTGPAEGGGFRVCARLPT